MPVASSQESNTSEANIEQIEPAISRVEKLVEKIAAATSQDLEALELTLGSQPYADTQEADTIIRAVGENQHIKSVEVTGLNMKPSKVEELVETVLDHPRIEEVTMDPFAVTYHASQRPGMQLLEEVPARFEAYNAERERDIQRSMLFLLANANKNLPKELPVVGIPSKILSYIMGPRPDLGGRPAKRYKGPEY